MVASMSDILALTIETFRQYNIIFLAVLIMLQGIGVPTGLSVLVMASGAFASAGEFDLFLLFGEVWLLTLLGDSVGYWTWRQFGLLILRSFPRLQRSLDPKLRKTSIFFRTHGKVAIIVTRFPLSALGALVNAIAGITKYRYLDFVLTVMVGEFFWVAFYLGVGYWFGDAWETISDLITQFGMLVGLIILLLMVLYFSYRMLSKKRSF